MKNLLMIAVLAACAPAEVKSETAPVPATEEAPCHNPVKIRKEAKRIVFIQCDGSETELLLSEITGPTGKPGATGERGPSGGRGPVGPDSSAEVIKWCRHDPRDHINRTVNIKISDAVKMYGGYNGQADYPGACGATEGKCACDNPICNNGNPQVHHYLSFGED